MMMNMQDPSTYQQQQQQLQQIKPPQFPEQQEHLKCPRCDSSNTKFCYYNNYNLSQPRHFCKNCRRYWTKGGALRNIPVGGGSRKNSTKRPSNPKRHSSNLSSSQSPSSVTNSTANSSSTQLLNALNSGLKPEPSSIYGSPVDQECRMLDISGSFSSLLASSGQFGSLLAGFNPNGSSSGGGGARTMQLGEFTQSLNSDTGLGLDMGRNPDLELQSGNHSDSFLGIQSGDSSCWSTGGAGAGGGGINGWPDLAI